MSWNNQQQGLPASPEGLQRQLVYVDVNTPPYVPNYACAAQVQQYLPVISALAAMEIQNNAQKNPLRIFYFNYCSQNNFANEQFVRVVSAIADWMDMAMSRQQYQSPEVCLQDIVPKFVEMSTMAQCRLFPELDQYVQQTIPAAYARIVQLVQTFDSLATEIQQFQSGGGWNNRSSNQGGQSWASSRASSNQGSFNNVGQQAWGQQDSWQPTRANVQTHASGGSALFAGDGTKQWRGARADEGGSTSRFERQNATHVTSIGGEPEVRPEVVEVAQVEVMEPSMVRPEERIRSVSSLEANNRRVRPEDVLDVELITRAGSTSHVEGPLVLADESSLKWRPSRRQPYAIAYNPRTHLLYHKQLADHTVVELAQERSPGTVDYEKHKLSRTFGPAARKLDVDQVQAKLERFRETIAAPTNLDDPVLGEDAQKLLSNRIVSPMWVMEGGEETCWLVGMVGRYADRLSEVTPDIYHRPAKMLTPVWSEGDEYEAVRVLSVQRTYADVRTKLLELGDSINPELWYLCERKMTELVNRVLNQQLSISTIRITSFVEDVLDLPAVIRDKIGDLFADAFLVNQEKSIRTTFDVLADEFKDVEDDITSRLLVSENFPEGTKKPEFVFLSNNITMTYLSCLSQELEIELNPKQAVLVTSQTPFVLELVRDITTNIAPGFEFDRHFIRTADGRILELTQGLIGEGALLLKLIR